MSFHRLDPARDEAARASCASCRQVTIDVPCWRLRPVWISGLRAANTLDLRLKKISTRQNPAHRAVMFGAPHHVTRSSRLAASRVTATVIDVAPGKLGEVISAAATSILPSLR